MTFNFETGEILLINKPYKWTSFDVVNSIKILIKKKLKKKIKVGHAGTLDPLATGLLIICTGKYTKKIEEFQNLEKEYTGTFTLGATTPCFDLEKPIDFTYPTNHITNELIEQTSKKFIGNLLQTPPIYSAIQIDGERAYNLARKGKEVEIKAKEITISEFEILKIEMPNFDFRIKCSKGTYIRSIARDFGKELNSGAYLSKLCRTKIGTYSLENALSTEEIKNAIIEQYGTN